MTSSVVAAIIVSYAMQLPPPTSRLRFRLYREDDLDAVTSMFGDPDARRFYPNMIDENESRRWIRWNLDHYRTYGFGLWVIESREGGTFVGDCGLTYQQVEGDRMLEVGYHVQARHRGRGLAVEAGHACVAHALGLLGAASVCSIVDPDNTPSLRVASRLHSHSREFTNHKGNPMVLFWTEAGDEWEHRGRPTPRA